MTEKSENKPYKRIKQLQTNNYPHKEFKTIRVRAQMTNKAFLIELQAKENRQRKQQGKTENTK